MANFDAISKVTYDYSIASPFTRVSAKSIASFATYSSTSSWKFQIFPKMTYSAVVRQPEIIIPFDEFPTLYGYIN